jgi:hypothetical protein
MWNCTKRFLKMYVDCINTYTPSSRISVHSSITRKHFSAVDLLPMNPNCLKDNTPFPNTGHTI